MQEPPKISSIRRGGAVKKRRERRSQVGADRRKRKRLIIRKRGLAHDAFAGRTETTIGRKFAGAEREDQVRSTLSKMQNSGTIRFRGRESCGKETQSS